ncbi:unnamed protein product, partial [Effrenium voratum]
DAGLNQSQIDKLFNGVVLAIASERERRSQNLMGQEILRLQRRAALGAFKIKNPSSFSFEFPGFSWMEEEAVEQARASMALPITGGSILVLALLSLNFFHRTFTAPQDKQVLLEGRFGGSSPGLDTSSTATPPLSALDLASDNLEAGFEDRIEDASTLQGSMQNDDYAVSVSSGDEVPPPPQTKPTGKAPFLSLFRFATSWDIFCTVIASLLGCVHGACMPMAFFFLSDLYHAVYMPNDDGSLPPVATPHHVRDAKVAEVGMTYVLLALVVLIARTGGCYMVIHAADRQVIAARREYFKQILMQGPSWHDLHSANELAPQLVQDTHRFRDGIGERLVDCTRAFAMALSATVLACSRDWKITILMAVIMPIAGLCMALSVEVVRNFAMVMEKCYARASEVCAFRHANSFNDELPGKRMAIMFALGQVRHFKVEDFFRAGLWSGASGASGSLGSVLDRAADLVQPSSSAEPPPEASEASDSGPSASQKETEVWDEDPEPEAREAPATPPRRSPRLSATPVKTAPKKKKEELGKRNRVTSKPERRPSPVKELPPILKKSGAYANAKAKAVAKAKAKARTIDKKRIYEEQDTIVLARHSNLRKSHQGTLAKLREPALTYVPVEAFLPDSRVPKRCRMPPLKSWRNERVVYQRLAGSMTPSVAAVELDMTPEDRVGSRMALPALQPDLDREAVEFLGITTENLTSKMYALPQGRSSSAPCTVALQGCGVLHVLDGELRFARADAEELLLPQGSTMLVKGAGVHRTGETWIITAIVQ